MVSNGLRIAESKDVKNLYNEHANLNRFSSEKNLVRHGKKRDHEFEGECGEVYERVWMEEAKERNYNIMSIIL